jgi:diguanylate cyclase (GGDEF)-like protein
VTWKAPADGGSPIVQYTITAWIAESGTVARRTRLAPERSFTRRSSTPGVVVAELPNGVAYRFTVTATNAVGTSRPSRPSNTVTLGVVLVAATQPEPIAAAPPPPPRLPAATGQAGVDIGSSIGGEPVLKEVVPPLILGTIPTRSLSPTPPLLVGFVAGLGLVLAFLLLALWFRARTEANEAQSLLAAVLGLSRNQLGGIPAGRAALVLSRVSDLNRRLIEMENQATVDDLTGVLRRGAGLVALERDIARVRRSGTAMLTVAFVDIDGLKDVNDTLGHVHGDELLRAVSRALVDGVRGQDLVFRFGGDEFVCIFPDARALAVRLRLGRIRDQLSERVGRRAFSFGTADLEPDDNAETVLARADANLYERRATGEA